MTAAGTVPSRGSSPKPLRIARSSRRMGLDQAEVLGLPMNARRSAAFSP
ncbi:hypothetical protein T261_7688 [Streptomyces lydicus]|nr:hypothetical protein T261_7688 [Streptomyces lydicus]